MLFFHFSAVFFRPFSKSPALREDSLSLTSPTFSDFSPFPIDGRQNGRSAPRQGVSGQRVPADPRPVQPPHKFVQQVRRKGLEAHRRTEPRGAQRRRPKLLFALQERHRRSSTGEHTHTSFSRQTIIIIIQCLTYADVIK